MLVRDVQGGKLNAKNFLNIPHTQISTEFALETAAFEQKFGMKKPEEDDLILVYCQKGRRGMMGKCTFF